MKRIILHWTAGKYKPNNIDLEHYHYLVDDCGQVFKGVFDVRDNENCSDGCYAKHTGGGNTGSIGVALCAMYGYESALNVGAFPITKVQLEKTFRLCAELIKKYNILLGPETLMTHYEFGQKHPHSSSATKIDITYLPPYPNVFKDEVGAFIRAKVRWYLERI